MQLKIPKLLFSAILALLLGFKASLGEDVANEDRLIVPGGTAAVASLLDGVDPSPERFVTSLNRVLLEQLNLEHKWEKVSKRVVLVQYLDALRDLKQRFPTAFEVALEPKPLRKNLTRLVSVCGYDARVNRSQLTFNNDKGEEAASLRRICGALGWDFDALAREVNQGKTVTLRIEDSTAPSPLSFGQWQAISNRSLAPDTALGELARDERLGMILEGRRRLSSDTVHTFDREHLFPWIYNQATSPFFRYAAALRTRAGQLVVPGGNSAGSLWSSVVGESLNGVGQFVRTLLVKKDSRVAFIWHALWSAPPEMASFFLESENGIQEQRSYLKKVISKLDNVEYTGFDQPNGGDLGFGTLARSVPLNADRQRLRLPGGPGLWWASIKGEEAPVDLEALRRISAKSLRDSMDDGELILRVLNEATKVGGYDRPALPRLIRASNLFGERTEELLTPENVVLVSRAVERYPSSLSLLEDLPLTEPEAVREYLLTVASLDALSRSVETELLIANFQGGAEWIRALARAGSVSADLLQRYLRRWATVHRNESSPFAVAPAELAWVADLVGELPPQEAGAPGRSPLERALIAALADRRDPQMFTWSGAEYQGRRERDLRQAMANRIVAQGIPSADEVVALYRGFQELRASCSAGDVERATSLARELAREVGALPSPSIGGDDLSKEMKRIIFPVDRPRLQDLLRSVGEKRTPTKLQRAVDEVDLAMSLLTRELRPLLLAPAYLAAMGDDDNILFESPDLIRRHLIFEFLDRIVVTDSPWMGARLVSDPATGSHVIGHLAGLPAILADYVAGALVPRDRGSSLDPERMRLAFDDRATTSWYRLTPDVTSLVAIAVGAGDELLESALGELRREPGPALNLAESFIPFARLEHEAARAMGEGSLVSWSERFVVGLAALAPDSAWHGRAPVSTGAESAFASAVERLGQGWRERLAACGVPTPALNGRETRWMGPWTSYEYVENERFPTALSEREVIDIKVAVLNYLGDRGLPGEVGQDLMLRALLDGQKDLRLESRRDWEGMVRWTNRLDRQYFDDRMRECFALGLYSLQLS